ncbi:MAG: hypothetical protein KBG84_11425 [Planctomycetes bacterium]|nr:hypothetical protein [Planctomycetota bacterium]
MNKVSKDWPFAEGTRIEVGTEVKAVVAADTTLAQIANELPYVDIARQFAWCDSQAKAARKLEDLSATKVSADKAREIVAKAYTQRMARVKNIKSDQDVTIQREK